MKKLSIIFILIFAFAFTMPVQAQTDDTPQAGSTPASPLYFIERAIEGIGTFFTAGDTAKAQRYLSLAEERLAEAQALADDGDVRAERAIDRYETQMEKARERVARTDDADLQKRITDATTHHIETLDAVLDRVPQEAQEAIKQAKERSIRGHIESLRGFAEEDPDRAIEAFDRAAEARLRAAQRRAERDNTASGEVQNALDEFEQYAEAGNAVPSFAAPFGDRAASMESRMQEIMTRHQETLEAVRERVPEEARDAIDRAIEHSKTRWDRREEDRSATTEARRQQMMQPEEMGERRPEQQGRRPASASDASGEE